MKRILLHLVFVFAFIIRFFAGACYSQNSISFTSFGNESGPENDKEGDGFVPLATPDTAQCIFGTDTLTLIITGTDISCFGGNDGTATVSVTGGLPPYTYNWIPSSQTTPTATGFFAGTKTVEVWDATGVNYCTVSIALTEPAALLVSIIPPLPVTSCFGNCDGSATASPSGGNSPYTYSWNTVPIQTNALATGLCAQNYTLTVTDDNGCVKTRTVTIGQPASLVANGSSTTINCFGNCNGSASVAPTGGNPPYTYSWSPTGSTTSAISALCPGNYTCTITDTKTCVATYIASITEPPALSATVTGANLLCNGVCTGSVTAAVSGGIPSYTYSWSPGGATTSSVTGLCAGNYSLTVTDANGCTLTNTMTLTQPPALSASPGFSNITCFGACDGSVSANPSGGTPPYTYSWLPGGCTTDTCSSLCPGTYSSTITDANGCTISNTVTITEPALLTVAPSKTDVICPGFCNGTADANASGGTTPYTYSWSPGGQTTSVVTGLCAGTYTIDVTDANGCTASAIITITMPSPLLTNLSSTNASCFGVCDGSVASAAAGGTPPYTYSWSNGCTTSVCTGLCAGNYTLTLTDINGCPATSVVSVSEPGILSASISASPNPLNCNGDCNGTAVVSVSGGTPLYTYLWSTGSTNPSVTGLCAGVYSITVTDANNCTSSASVTFLQPATLTVTITSSNPTCNGICNGSISAMAGGGTPGYTFAWLPGGQTTSLISSQCAGNYTVTVCDSKGCCNTQTITLTAPSVLAANAVVVSNVSCAPSCNGSAVSTPSGGTPPYTFLWTGGQTTSTATGLCAGTFSVTVTDANGCFDINIISITQPTVLSSSLSSTTSSCILCNGTATVSTSGGTFPYTFLWTPSGQTTSAASGLCIGTYTVNVTDANGCTNVLTTVINPVVTITITVSGTIVSCAGACDGIATATPFGGFSPYTYSWSTAPVQTTPSATGLCAGIYSVTVADVNGCIATNTVTFTNPPALSVSMSSTVASCGLCNGTATSTPSGGTGAYTYTWSGFPVQTTATATGLCSGNYTVTVADANNCTATNTVSVGNIPVISDNPSITLATCGASDGAICVSPSGGTPGYTYLWSPGGSTVSCITGLTAGIYTVTITDAAGCSNTFAIVVGNITGPTITVTSQIPPICNGDCNGSITVSASGTNPPFTYLWSPGGQTTTTISALCVGTYIVQVTNAVLCTSFASVTLTDPPQMNSNPTITNVSCNGGNDGSICLSPSGGNSPYTFSWSPGGQTTSCITGLTAGTYTVILSDATGCDDTIFIPVTEPILLNVTITSTNVTCNGDCDGTATATVTGGTTLYTYLWSTGAPLPSIVGLCPGTYSIIVTDNNGCTAAASVALTEPAILSTTLTSTNITCNSLCDGTATIAASGGTVAYTYLWNTTPAQSTSIITGLCIGNYAGTVTDANGCSSTQSVSITQPAALSATVTFTNASCFGGCNGTASASASGGTGTYTYLWNPGGLTASSVIGLCTGSYTLSVSDANGCVTNNLFSISAPSLLQANITNTPPSCFGGCNGTATSSPVGGTGLYTYAWNTVPVQTTAAATGLCSGSYTLTLSDGNGCSINQPVTIAAPLVLTQANGVAGATCGACNGSITIIASGGTSPYSFFWNTGATTATITGLCAGVYVDTVMDANGCISVDTMAVSNTTGPTITVSSTSVTCNGFCNGTGTVTFATGDGPPWIYSWFPSNQTTVSVTGLCPAQYFASVTDTNGCVTIDPINITEPAPLASNPVVTNATCFGLCDGNITTSATGGTGALTYSWTPGGQTTTSITGQCAGSYTLTIIDANGCVLTNTFIIGQNTILTSTVTSANASCNASCDGTATMNVSGGTLPYTYSWCNGQTTSATTGLCAGTCTVIVTDAIGCIRIDSAIISQPAVLVSNITGTNPLCNGSCDGSVSSAPTGGTPPYTYAWSNGCSTSACTGLCAATYTLILTDANNCAAANTVVLTDPPLISLTGVVTNANCANTCEGSIDITPSGGTGAYTFLWSNSAVTEDVTGLCPGIYSVTITDANGCTFTDSMTVGVTTLVIALAGNDTSFCAGGTATLCSGSINATSIAWYQIQSPTWTFIGITNCVNQSPPVGITDYALIATNGICSDTDTVSVTVNNYPVVIPPVNDTICAGDSTTLCASGATVYQWYSLPAWTSIATGNCITVSPPVGTTSYGIIGMNGVCSDTDSVSVTVLAMPIAIAGNDTATCFGNSVMFCSSSLNAASVAWYTIPAWTLVNTTTCITVIPPAGINDFVLIAFNGICSDTDTVSATIYFLPFVDAGTNVTILSTGSTVLNGSGTGTYLWSPSTGLSNTTIASPTANPSSTTTYTLSVTDINGCTASDMITVTVIQDVLVYDGVSPNGDGINDLWEIANIELFPNSVVEVYNRWGELLFRSVGYAEKWNCKYNGSDLPVGTYYFVIVLNSDLHEEPLTGPITIMR